MALQAFLITGTVAFVAFVGGAFLASSLARKHTKSLFFLSLLFGAPIVLFFGFCIAQEVRCFVRLRNEFEATGVWGQLCMLLFAPDPSDFCFPLSGDEIAILFFFALGWLLIGCGIACNVLRDEESVETNAQ